jgi:hypothetical protein
MMKTSLLVAAMLAASAGVARAGGQAGSIGLGAEFQLSGLGGASLNYDAGKFHAGGFLGYSNPTGADNTLVEFGGRFFWHLHSTAMSDFGVGGDLGIAYVPVGMGMNATHNTDVFLEPAFQIRAFLVSNVALSFTTGVLFGLNNNKDVAITGQGIGGSVVDFGAGNVVFTAGAGIHYYFF